MLNCKPEFGLRFLPALRYVLRMDHLTPEKRSWNMSRIRAKDTKPEILVRPMLHRAGYRFRKNVSTLSGKPDLKNFKPDLF